MADEEGAYAARMDEWVAWEAVEGTAPRARDDELCFSCVHFHFSFHLSLVCCLFLSRLLSFRLKGYVDYRNSKRQKKPILAPA
jgi:hypothetical protein